jgi:putative oxidoreductase
MAAAYFIERFPDSPWPAVNQRGAAILFCFVFLYLVFTGPWTVDAMRKTATAAR